MFRLEKILLNDLERFVASDRFKSLEDKPISTLRVASYLKNPNAEANDVVLYMAFDGAKIVGYRTIWRDTFTLEHHKPESFGWLSGNWVHENYRRKGVSTLLFNEVFKDWKGRLMYTNYAVNSKLLYDKTGHFKQIKSLVGTRFYTRFCLGDILVKKHKVFFSLKKILVFLDKISNFLFDIRFLFFKQQLQKLSIKKHEEWSPHFNVFLKKYKEKEFFKRNKNIYQWIQKYPWVKTNDQIKEESKAYFFMCYAKVFKSNYYTFYDSQENLIAWIWLSVLDGHLKIPYAYFEKEQLNEITSFIINKIKEEKVKTIVVYNSAIEKELRERIFFLAKKTFYQNFFATEDIKIIPDEIEKKEIQTGNGDVIFT